MKQKVFIEDVKKSVAVAGSEQDKKTQIDAIAKERLTYTDKVRSLADLNRKTSRQLNEEIIPRLNSVTNKIKRFENSKNVKLEVRSCSNFFRKEISCFHFSCFGLNSIKFIKELCGFDRTKVDLREKSTSR